MSDHADASLPPPPPRPSGLRRLAITFVLLFLIWAFFAYVFPHLLGGGSGKAPPETRAEQGKSIRGRLQEQDEKITGLQKQVDTLEARVQALEDVVAAPPAPSSPAETPAPEAEPRSDEPPHEETRALQEQLRSQQRMMAEMKRMMALSQHRLAAIAAFDALRQKAEAGEPFRAPLERLLALPLDEKAQDMLARLAPHADGGVATLETLQQAFEHAVTQALHPASTGWKDKVRSLIRVRKVGEDQPGTDDEAVIARAEAKLQRGEVAQAVKEIALLSPPASDAFAAWRVQAKTYRETRAIMAALHTELLSGMAPVGNADRP